jgi:hypothetical protein
MAVSNLVAPSSGLSASDLVTIPQWTLLGSYTSSTFVYSTTLSSIPQTYRKLRLYINVLYFNSPDFLGIRPNNNSSNLYVQYGIQQYAGSTGRISNSGVTQWKFSASSWASSQTIDAVIEIENYNSSTENKFMNYEQYGFTPGAHFVEKGHGFFANTNPITSLTFFHLGGSSFGNSNNYTGVGIFLYGAK